MDRNSSIVRVSLVGIGANLFLAGLKLAVGLAANSVAVLTDAVNNFTDMLSSVITIIGTRLSEKEPDRAHPFGYGRIEHLASPFIGLIIFYAGIDAMRRSVWRILHPETSGFSAVTLLVIAAAVLVKIHIGLYTKRRGRALESQALTASGREALGDSAVSASTLAAALVYLTTGFDIEAWVGALISLVILRAGFLTLRETADTLLGGAGRDLQLPGDRGRIRHRDPQLRPRPAAGLGPRGALRPVHGRLDRQSPACGLAQGL